MSFYSPDWIMTSSAVFRGAPMYVQACCKEGVNLLTASCVLNIHTGRKLMEVSEANVLQQEFLMI